MMIVLGAPGSLDLTSIVLYWMVSNLQTILVAIAILGLESTTRHLIECTSSTRKKLGFRFEHGKHIVLQ